MCPQYFWPSGKVSPFSNLFVFLFCSIILFIWLSNLSPPNSYSFRFTIRTLLTGTFYRSYWLNWCAFLPVTVCKKYSFLNLHLSTWPLISALTFVTILSSSFLSLLPSGNCIILLISTLLFWFYPEFGLLPYWCSKFDLFIRLFTPSIWPLRSTLFSLEQQVPATPPHVLPIVFKIYLFKLFINIQQII